MMKGEESVGQPHSATTDHPPSMAKSTTAAVSYSPASSLSSSPTVRFLGSHLRVPEKPSDLNSGGLDELHESDVVWSSSSDVSEIPSPSNVSSSPPVHRQYNSGLYAALSDDQHPLVRRKHAVSPSQSAASAARTVPPVRRSSEHSSVGYHQSAPVNVPVWPKSKSKGGYLGQFDEVVDKVAEEEEEDEGEMVPPHEIVARSYVTFSVFEGAGRTLKGRDLCRVRNAVFQKTGFLD